MLKKKKSAVPVGSDAALALFQTLRTEEIIIEIIIATARKAPQRAQRTPGQSPMLCGCNLSDLNGAFPEQQGDEPFASPILLVQDQHEAAICTT